jgi:hypothetical protein
MRSSFNILLGLLSLFPTLAEWNAAESLREYMRNKDPEETHGTSVASLRGSYNIDEDLRNALYSPRLSTVQVAIEHALTHDEKEYDQVLFQDATAWFNELEHRMATLKYCQHIRGYIFF